MKMRRKRYKSVLLLVALVFTAVFTSDMLQARASEKEDSPKEETSGKGKDFEWIDTSGLEEEKKDTLDKIKNIKSELADVKNKIKELENQKSDLNNYIAKLDQEANGLAEQIRKLSDEIEVKKGEIARTQAELEEAQRISEKQYEDMKLRIQYMYEHGTPSYLELFLTAESMSDFLNRSTYAAEVSRYDRSMLDQYIEQKEKIAAAKAVLESEEEELNLMAEAAKEQKETVDALIQTKTAQIQSYQNEINNQSGEAQAYQEDLEEQERLLKELEAQIAAAALANARAEDGDGGASGFLWPCPSSRRITSDFGMREIPTPGATANHNGIDIGAPTGSAILASASGRVTTSKYSYSAGNYIVISHGNGVSTVYMHCSALYVSEGEMVSQGQTIGAVGSTGFSTGPHLHFGVMVNGAYVNPRNYVG
ncbi:MAG: peptidoglycan DD-metalloendopeptidase family protein [Lachnospiraceae bacterium]|nr:peptidoglycan DD-metalloendopeptidase family protein [Lachnospiraceae bacterium]